MNDAGDFDQLVLVVDDDPAIQQMYCTLLKRQGIRSDIAADGDIALQRLRSREYGAVLLDLMLPRTNGFEVIRHLKCLRPEILDRVIVVTAASERTLEYLDAGDVRKVLRKPFDIDELVSDVRDCMMRRARPTV
jgi:DNA-binding response OmpR family regulator